MTVVKRETSLSRRSLWALFLWSEEEKEIWEKKSAS